MAEEGMSETPNKLIHIGKPIEMDDAWLEAKLAELERLTDEGYCQARNLVQEIVPTYKY